MLESSVQGEINEVDSGFTNFFKVMSQHCCRINFHYPHTLLKKPSEVHWFARISKSLDFSKIKSIYLQDINGKEKELFEILKCFRKSKKIYNLNLSSKFGFKRDIFIE